MIPLKLSLHNFMPYRDPQPLDLEGLHLACLAGNNGHGKSALLDAITWALWGKARSNSADELIHLGESEMWVDFQFSLAGNRYRVLRSRERRGRSGKSDLQLQIWLDGPEAGEWRPISEPTIRETERRIVQLLRMDYETFINSAFLVQGRADEFTMKPANERKRILADILGLSLYDEYEGRAKERARQARDEAGHIEGQMAGVDRELAQEPQYRQDLQAAEAETARLSDELQAADRAYRSLYAERQDLLAQQRTLEDLQRRLQQAERQLAELADQLARDQARLASDQALAARGQEIEAGYASLLEVRQTEADWNKKLAAQAALQDRRSSLAQQIDQARHRLEIEQRMAAEAATRLAAQAGQAATWAGQLAQAQAELARLAQEEARRDSLRARLQALAEEKASLEAQNKRLREEMKEIEERINLLAQAGADCPVCGQPLGEAERQAVLAGYQEQGKGRGDQFRANKGRLAEIAAQTRTAEAGLAEAGLALQQFSRWQRQEAQAEARLAEAQQAEADLAGARAMLLGVEARLASADYALEAQAGLARIEEELALLGYDPQAHDQARQALLTWEPFQERYSQLQAARERLVDLQGRIQQAQAGQQLLQETLAADQGRRDMLAAAVARLPQIERELRVRAAEVERLETAERQARQRLGAAQQKLATCQALTQQRQELAGRLAEVKERQALFEELQAAFGKKGLQAMIIESAIPEIEAEANQLLNRMTDGRMSVRMETQRETKTTQELRETLDIILSDELGSRDYALFSGGEAFRANFAIRIALSKLLARRAGAALQTLIIDEGFGSQDAQGRERLVEAINAIQDDFERVLVITHIDELKDHFPVRIEIVKTAGGSQISLS